VIEAFDWLIMTSGAQLGLYHAKLDWATIMARIEEVYRWEAIRVVEVVV
jgi:hypothetical protein